MSHRTTSERGSRIWPPPDPRRASWPPVAEVAPEHRPRREPPAVRVELVAAGPAALEPRHEQVDQPLRLAQLGRGHPVELAVAEDLALRVGVGRRRRRPRSSPRRRRRSSSTASAMPRSSGRRLGRLARRPRAARRRSSLLGRRSSSRRQRRRAEVAGQPRPRRRHQRSKTRVVDRRGRRGGGRRRPRRPPGPARGRRCRRGSARGRSRPRRRGRSTAAPPGAPARTRPPRRAAAGRRPRARTARGRSPDRAGRAARSSRSVAQPPARRPRPGSAAVASPRTWRMSSSYLRTTPSVSSTSSGASSRAPSDRSAAAQSSVSAMPGHLGQVRLAQAMDEADDLAGEPLGRLGDPGEDDLVLLLRRRVVDPVVEAAALERVVDLARPVRGEDDPRRRLGLDRADLRDRDLEVGQDLEQVRLELLVGPVDLVDQQDRRRRRRSPRAPGGAAAGSGSRRRRCRGRSRGRPRRGPRAAGSRASGAGSSTRRRRC